MIDNKTLEEYFRIYKPWEAANNCCYICKKCIDGCSWSRSLEPIKGWKASKSEKRADEPHDGYKIFFCPEFEEGNASEGREYDEDCCMDLLEAVYHNAAEDYKSAYKQKLKAERRGASLFREEIITAEGTMRECSYLLGEWTDKLKSMVEKELALEEGDADG